MLDAALKALAQMMTPPFRTVLWKSIGVAIVVLILIGIALQRVYAYLAAEGSGWLDGVVWGWAQMPLHALIWAITIAVGLGLFAGAIFLMPAVTSLVASFFVDEIAAEVEHTYYPADPPGTELPLWRAVIEGSKTALLAVCVYLVALPFLLLAGFGAVIFFLATAFLLGREYFVLAAMRFRSPAEAKRLRKMHQGTVFIGGLFIAAFVSIPIVNLATPLFGTAFMVHLHKRLAGPRSTLTEPERDFESHPPG